MGGEKVPPTSNEAKWMVFAVVAIAVLTPIIAAVALILVLFALTTAALAHSWYPLECCSDRDCKPIDCVDLIETRDGFEYFGAKFGKNSERPSQDRRCHVCISRAGNGLCVFTLQGT